MIVKNSKYINAISFNNPELSSRYNSSKTEHEIEESPDEEIVLLEFDELLTQLKSEIELYENDKDIKKLENAINIFSSIPKYSKNLTNDTVKNSVQLEDSFNKIRLYCYSLDNKRDQESYVKMLAEKIFLGWKYDKDIVYYKDNFLLRGLVAYNKDKLKNIQERLNYLKYVTEFYEMYGDPYPKHEVIPEIVLPDNSDRDDNTNDKDNNTNNPGNGNNNGNNKDDNIKNDFDNIKVDTSIYSSITKFEKQGNKCYKVKENYRNGALINKNKALANKSEYSQCSIYDYIKFGSNVIRPVTEINKNHLYNNQNEDSEYTVYYTVTKDAKEPFYYDTGIKAKASDKSLTAEQLSDVFYQISVRAGGYNIKSNTKSLTVINGKPIVIDKEDEDIYTKRYVENMLNQHSNIGIKIMKQSEYKTMIDSLNNFNKEKKYINNILVNGDEISEQDIAWVENDELIKVSIKLVAELLGAKTKISDSTLVITKDTTEIIIEKHKKEYMIDGESFTFNQSVFLDNNSFISELADIPYKLGYDVDFDLEENKLEFIKIN